MESGTPIPFYRGAFKGAVPKIVSPLPKSFIFFVWLRYQEQWTIDLLLKITKAFGCSVSEPTSQPRDTEERSPFPVAPLIPVAECRTLWYSHVGLFFYLTPGFYPAPFEIVTTRKTKSLNSSMHLLSFMGRHVFLLFPYCMPKKCHVFC